MTLLDSRGRLLGKISVVDALALVFFLSLSPVFVFAYRVARPLQPRIVAVSPEELIPLAAFQIRGANFRQESQIRVGDRIASTEYYGSDLLSAYVPAELAPGSYPVTVKDPQGTVAAWAGRIKILASPPRSQTPAVVLVIFPDLLPGEADDLQRNFESQSKTPPKAPQPKLLRILKRGPMTSLHRDLMKETLKAEGKEFLLADILVPADIEEWDGVKRYFYQGQPLLLDFKIQLEFNHRSFNGIIQKEP